MSNNESEIVNYTKPAEVGYNIPAFLLIYQSPLDFMKQSKILQNCLKFGRQNLVITNFILTNHMKSVQKAPIKCQCLKLEYVFLICAV